MDPSAINDIELEFLLFPDSYVLLESAAGGRSRRRTNAVRFLGRVVRTRRNGSSVCVRTPSVRRHGPHLRPVSAATRCGVRRLNSSCGCVAPGHRCTLRRRRRRCTRRDRRSASRPNRWSCGRTSSSARSRIASSRPSCPSTSLMPYGSRVLIFRSRFDTCVRTVLTLTPRRAAISLVGEAELDVAERLALGGGWGVAGAGAASAAFHVDERHGGMLAGMGGLFIIHLISIWMILIGSAGRGLKAGVTIAQPGAAVIRRGARSRSAFAIGIRARCMGAGWRGVLRWSGFCRTHSRGRLCSILVSAT